jgi:hypothetical protein
MALAAAVLLAGAAPAAGAPLLPDLVMAPLTDVTATLSPSGREQLRFSATIANAGPGRLQIRSTRARVKAPWQVQQWVFDSAGPPTLRPTPALLRFGGDGHDHWHVRDLQRYELRDAGGQRVLRRQRKRGFCFFDTNRVLGRNRGGDLRPRYREDRCGGRRSLGLTTGISVGWGDRYPFSLPDQFIDVTRLPVGVYRLVAVVDPQDVVLEADETANTTSIDVRLSRTGGVPVATVLRSRLSEWTTRP